jgi:S-DNA-T family DNA segregation ATPase FtsK/SpoIIIE
MKKGKMATIRLKKLKSVINLSELYEDKDWHKFKNKPTFPLGMDTPTNSLVIPLENSYFNFLVGGKESPAKNNFFRCAVSTLLETSKKESLKFILISKKKSAFSSYKKIPNLLFPVITDPKCKEEAIKWCLAEMNRRFQLSDTYKGTFDEYDKGLKEKLPRSGVVVEEIDELMKSNPKFYKNAFDEINMLSSLVSIHFIVGVSKPSNVKVIPKKIIYGFFYRITFATANLNDTKMVIGEKRLAKLKNSNELFYNYGRLKERAVHLKGFHISEREIKKQLK